MIIYDITEDIKDNRFYFQNPKTKWDKNRIFGTNIYLKFKTGIIRGLLKYQVNETSIIVYAEVYASQSPIINLLIHEYPLFPNVDSKLMLKAIRNELINHITDIKCISWSFNPQDLI